MSEKISTIWINGAGCYLRVPKEFSPLGASAGWFIGGPVGALLLSKKSGKKQGNLFVTDKRLLFKSLWGTTAQSFKFEHIEDIEYIGSGNMLLHLEGVGTIQFDFHNFTIILDGENHINKLRNYCINRKKEIVGDKNNDNSIADEINKFHDLMIKGAISEDEFEAKKKQLLNL